eukprot:scaffold573393_cov20-Prasinocladus_malaysianus.AAC.1
MDGYTAQQMKKLCTHLGICKPIIYKNWAHNGVMQRTTCPCNSPLSWVSDFSRVGTCQHITHEKLLCRYNARPFGTPVFNALMTGSGNQHHTHVAWPSALSAAGSITRYATLMHNLYCY